MFEETLKSVQNLIAQAETTDMGWNGFIEGIIALSASSIFKLIIGFLAIYIGFKIIRTFVKRIVVVLERQEIDITLVKFLEALMLASLKVGLVLMVFGFWQFDLTAVAALVASAGVAIGLALQGSLSNFAGGFIILFIRPFKVGDYIETSGYSGEVEQIGLFYTTLKTVDNKQVLIPNGALSNGSLVNYSSNPIRRVDLTFSVSYDTDIQHVKAILTEIVNNHELILEDPEPLVRMGAHEASSIDFVVRAWCETLNYWDVYFDLLEIVKIRFDKENISIPYPQMDLHVTQIQK